tara:strand:- start:703 stop:1083 length:381 start_codon:yes stop_codon:yes gene_type:complete
MVNYVSDFICTYNLIDDLDDSELLFRTQLLQAFIPEYLEEDNKKSLDQGFDEINKITEELFNKYGSNKIIKKLMEKCPGDSDEIKFQMCFSYSLFYLTHKILCGLINNNLDEKICNKLIEDLDISK